MQLFAFVLFTVLLISSHERDDDLWRSISGLVMMLLPAMESNLPPKFQLLISSLFCTVPYILVSFLHQNDDDQTEAYMMCIASYLLAQCMAFSHDFEISREGEERLRPCTSWQFIPSCVLATVSVAALLATHPELNLWCILFFVLGVVGLLVSYEKRLRPTLVVEDKHGFADMFMIKFLLNLSILLFTFIAAFSRPLVAPFFASATGLTFAVGWFAFCHMTGETLSTLLHKWCPITWFTSRPMRDVTDSEQHSVPEVPASHVNEKGERQTSDDDVGASHVEEKRGPTLRNRPSIESTGD
jgi:hypothetical protein